MSEFGFVYIIQEDYSHRYKIGKTRKLNDRMNLFAVKLPFAFDSIHTIYCDDYHSLERFLHEHFKHKRVRGEWFDLTDKDVEWIKGESYLGENGNKLDKKVATEVKEYIQNASNKEELIENIMNNSNTTDEVRNWYSIIEEEMKQYHDEIWVKPAKVFVNYYSPDKVFASVRIRATHISIEVYCGNHPIPGTYQTETEIEQGRRWSRFKVRKEEDVKMAVDCIKTAFNIIK